MTLRNELQPSETRLSESAWQNQEVPEPRDRELEALQEQLGNVESREMILRDQQHKLEAQIAESQRELSTGKEKVQELDATRKRLAEMEHVCQELREENHRLEEEISRWQERIAESEETQRQFSTLRQQSGELQTKQAAVSEANSLIDGLGEKSSNNIDLNSDDSAARVHAANDEQIKPLVRTSAKQKWRFRIITATGAIAIAAAVAVGFLDTSSNKLSESKEPAVAPENVSTEQSMPIEATSKTLKRPSPAAGENEFSKPMRRRVQKSLVQPRFTVGQAIPHS